MKLLVSIDSSDASKSLIGEIAARPWPPATKVCVMNVVDLFTLTSGFVYSERVAKAETDAAEDLVSAAAQRLKAAGLDVTTVVAEGYPKTDIIDYAAHWPADLIALGSHGHGALFRFFLGSVASEVVRSAPCSVEIVRQKPPRGAKGSMKLLLAVDKSASSRAAAHAIANRPWPQATEIRIISVVDASIPAIEPWYGAQDIITRMEEDRAKMAEEAVELAAQTLANTDFIINTAVLEGNPKPRIVDEARDWDADLIFIGSHGRRGINRILLGSVSEAVAVHAPCSVAVIREPKEQKEG